MRIRFKSGLRHQLVGDISVLTHIRPVKDIVTEYIELRTDGYLLIRHGYTWDGPSGPCRLIADRLPVWLRHKYLKTILPGSLVHDALYELIRQRHLAESFRKLADLEFKRINLECGMSKVRAWWTYEAVRKAGSSAADPKNSRPIYTMP